VTHRQIKFLPKLQATLGKLNASDKVVGVLVKNIMQALSSKINV
jgi:hypothetical protein